ncbi:MAG: DMT family transporter [Candidatus Dormibacteraceae bacterium]
MIKPYLALAALALVWGFSFLLIKIGLRDMAPTVLMLIRAASGCAALTVFMLATRRKLFGGGWKRRIVPYTVLAVTSGVVPWTAIALGEQSISSGLASILNATTPLWAAVLVIWMIPNDRPSALNYVGVLIGLAGVVILVLPDLTAKGFGGSIVGAIAVIIASMSYAVSALYQRKKLRDVSVYEVSVGQLAITTLIAIPIATPSLPSLHLALPSLAAVVALGVGGSGLAYLLYYYIINTLGPVQGAGVTILVPVTAVLWGVILLGETLTLPIVIGMAVILAGIVLTNVRRPARREPVAGRDSAAA